MMKRMCVFALLARGRAVAGCGGSEGARAAARPRGPVVIGAAIAKSGLMARYDQAAFAALQLAVNNINR